MHISIKSNKNFLFYIFYLAPFLLISTVPFNQWNLAFEHYNIGIVSVSEIYVLIKCSSILGSYPSEKILNSHKNFNDIFVKYIWIDAILIALMYLINRPCIQATLFLIQVVYVSIMEIVVLRIVNETIGSDKRTTFLSIKNTFDAVLSMVIIGVMGIISDRTNIIWCWVFFAIISIGLMIVLEYKRKNLMNSSLKTIE